MAAPGIENKVETYVKQQPEWFENLVLGCALKDPQFYLRVRTVLCCGLDGEEKSDDFTERLRNAVYTAAADYNAAQCLNLNRVFVPISPEVMAIMLKNKCDDGDGILPDEIDQAMVLFRQAIEVDVPRWLPLVELGISRWLTDRKMMQVIQSPYMFGGWTLSQVRDRLAMVEEQSSVLEQDDRTRRGVMGFYLDNPSPDQNVNRLESNLTELNTILGGGFVKGDCALVISPSGGGKTILACQLAGHWSMSGVGGIFVTTEQPQEQLERRLLSNFARIPFSQVVNKWDPDALNEKQLADYKSWRDQMSSPIQVVDWTLPGNTIIANLRMEIETYKDTFGETPEYLIFDWVGGALQDAAKGDPAVLRSLYKSAVDTCCYLCAEYKMAGVVLAQATPGDSLNKCPLTYQHIADAKNMIEKVSVLVGLTAMFADDMNEETDHTKVMFNERQYLSASKSRKGPGGNARVRRRFEYQRLENF